MTDISLLVCTRNRSPQLAATLASIDRAIHGAPHLKIEVVVVDNGSTDDTADRLTAWSAERPFPVHLVHEPRPGLARARNIAMARASGRIVAMTDDDCVLDNGYFRQLATCFADVTGPAIIGGRILLGDPADLPVTVKLEDHPMIAPWDMFPGGFVMGANLAMTADAIARIGRFDERFGAGARFVSAEDTDFLFRALGQNIPVRYDPRFTVNHHHGRRCPDEVVRLLAGYSYGDGALYAKHFLRDHRVVKAIYNDIRNLMPGRNEAVTSFSGIQNFYLFVLRFKVKGFFSYLKMAVPL
ncbi:glycosyltransferase involved in cell wall biosynthesis [Sphingomonas insulae]|uniref:Glycosyltransferase 2-like domain-containing protein n=1 Tax=Sphingomonas insulae TaxID=424800 RepID=A0ABN1HRV8_9SPHN|nr:glycosyltransferase family 2 protein [Sphingomonas insulae]NIJ29099.1 glycosyltransferase involved in cell wall biosynthesis [Sphingomonas insulae]